ncbi:MAG TPA: hypothetical protein VGG03_03805, partial [Thermoanaerobaculia bacterium]
MKGLRSLSLGVLGLGCLAVLAGCSGSGARADAGKGGSGELVVRRGPFRERLLLTGELVAERGESLVVPRTNIFQLQIRWLAEDGTLV